MTERLVVTQEIPVGLRSTTPPEKAYWRGDRFMTCRWVVRFHLSGRTGFSLTAESCDRPLWCREEHVGLRTRRGGFESFERYRATPEIAPGVHDDMAQPGSSAGRLGSTPRDTTTDRCDGTDSFGWGPERGAVRVRVTRLQFVAGFLCRAVLDLPFPACT